MATTSTTTAPAPKATTLMVSILGAAICAAAAVAIWHYWPRRLPPLDGKPAELVKFCTSEQFARLPEDKKEQYVAALMEKGFATIIAAAAEAQLTPEERQRGLENGMEAGLQVRWGKHLDNWLALDEKAKAAYVKKVVAQMPARPPGMDPRGANRQNRIMTPQRQKQSQLLSA